MRGTTYTDGPASRRWSRLWIAAGFGLWLVLIGSAVAFLVIGGSYVATLFQTNADDGHIITNEERGMNLAVTLVLGGAALAGMVLSAVPLWFLHRARCGAEPLAGQNKKRE